MLRYVVIRQLLRSTLLRKCYAICAPSFISYAVCSVLRFANKEDNVLSLHDTSRNSDLSSVTFSNERIGLNCCSLHATQHAKHSQSANSNSRHQSW